MKNTSLTSIVKDILSERSTWQSAKAYFVAPKKAKYKDEKEVEKAFQKNSTFNKEIF